MKFLWEWHSPSENVLAKYAIACQVRGGLKTDTVLILPSSLSSHSWLHACVEVLANLLRGGTHGQTGERLVETSCDIVRPDQMTGRSDLLDKTSVRLLSVLNGSSPEGRGVEQGRTCIWLMSPPLSSVLTQNVICEAACTVISVMFEEEMLSAIPSYSRHTTQLALHVSLHAAKGFMIKLPQPLNTN